MDKLNGFCRIKSIAFQNFRNIENGKAEFPNGGMDDCMTGEPSVLGIYGQNGSGKTSLVMALELLKYALTGIPISPEYIGCIRCGCGSSSLCYEFVTENSGDIYNVEYKFDLIADEEDGIPLADTAPVSADPVSLFPEADDNEKKCVTICNESIKYRAVLWDGTKIPLQTLIDTSEKAHAFGKRTKCRLFADSTPEFQDMFRTWITVSRAKSQSFLFSRKFLTAVSNFTKVGEHRFILLELAFFGSYSLHVITNRDTGANFFSGDIFFACGEMNNNAGLPFPVNIRLAGTADVPEEIFAQIRDAIRGIDIVMNKIVPGLSIELKDRGISADNKGKDVHRFELFSKRGDTLIPLQYESDGIKRLISIMSLFIAVYNYPYYTVVIDELDSGIFEYMLGEILQIMAESAQGQLIFTSHNLRPLEILPNKFLCFTTTDPAKKFTKLSNVSGNNNLRSQYFKNIILGGSDELYSATDRYEIEAAFYRANHMEGEDQT